MTAGAPQPAPSPLTLIHFGDLHLWRFGWDRDPFPKRLLGLANLALKRRRRFPPEAAQAALDRLAEESADYLLFSGDLSTTALASEFDAGRRLFAPLRARFGDRLIAIPGNHDRYTPRAARGQLFEKRFLEHTQSDLFVRELAPGWSLIAFDCSVPRWVTSTGRVPAPLLERLRMLGKRERARGQRLVVMGHYPVLYPQPVRAAWDHALAPRERAALQTTLTRMGASLFLHGHNHRRWAIRDGATLHLNCGSAGMAGATPDRQPGYLKITLGDSEAVAVQAHWWDPATRRWAQAAIQPCAAG